MSDKIERINPLKKLPSASAGEIASGVETALSQRDVGGLRLTSVFVGELDGREVEAMADLEQRIVVPISK